MKFSELFSQFGSNSGYIEDLYKLYLQNPSSVGQTWSDFFSQISNANFYEDEKSSDEVVSLPISSSSTNGTHAKSEEPVSSYSREFISSKGKPTSYIQSAVGSDALQERIYRFVSAFRNRGHLKAKINPLTKGVHPLPRTEDIEIDYYNFSEEQKNEVLPCAGFAGRESMRLGDLINQIHKVYCDTVGFELTHILSQEERLWLQNRIETRFDENYGLSNENKVWLLEKIIEAEGFEEQLHRKYVGHKRFSLQGGETLVPMLNTLMDTVASKGVKEIVFGMAHRGRLNVLRNVLKKPLKDIFLEFEDQNIFSALGSGDVKYHLGYSSTFENRTGESVDISLAPNPSHLEFVCPVVEGIVRAKQDLNYNKDRKSVLAVHLHGDAAFVGQGIVAETLNQSAVEGYSNGGSVHIIINNQIGFTTSPDESRSSSYCTEFAKAIQAPIMHINCEDIEAACWSIQLALEFRERYGRDVVLDLYCYRKYGHNEGDDPSFTQPITYSEIKNKKSAAQIFGENLVSSGLISDEQFKGFYKKVKESFDEASNEPTEDIDTTVGSPQGPLKIPSIETGVSREVLEKVANTLINHPEDFTPHPKLQKILEKRVATLTAGEGIDWGFAEGLAFGSLVVDGINVRLSGQDCGRGTFSQRHLTLNNYETADHYLPFSALEREKGATFEVYNSTLSENSILGFEFGYAAEAARNSLVLWEAQFGDFSNGAQVIIDQFISSSEQKWGQLSGVVMLLPHGYEGQGPEHSSARLERYLQLCARGNMQVCVPSNASQYFHLLRRQSLLETKRPMIVLTPKSLLRSSDAACNVEDLTLGQYHKVLEDTFVSNGKVEHVVFCSGKVYYDIVKAVSEMENPSVKVIRVEQLYPFPQFELKNALKDIEAKTYTWVQEEPRNMGSWFYMEPYLRQKFSIDINYVGRELSASTATGSAKHHIFERDKFISEMLKIIS